MTDKLFFFFRKEVPDRWVMVRNGTAKLGGLIIPVPISVSLLGAADLFR